MKVQGQPLVVPGVTPCSAANAKAIPTTSSVASPTWPIPAATTITVHQVLTEYLAVHSPVSPSIEGRAVATDAPADLLSQVEGTSYRFR